jgi:general secretion pathway protein E/type IV pilus assembly protein PilB
MKANMDIAEQRMSQDGRFSATILNNDTERSLMGMVQLGFFEEDIHKVENMFNEPFGIILLTGPTGSGKSTTLYAGIRSLNLLEKNVLTVEDPIEFSMPLLRQTQVNEKAGYNFANAIRYFLRHDPDVILVGEIRNSETAATATTASTTGHLVLSTIHTNSAVGAIPRLRDLGIRSFLIADSLIGVISQRLVRRTCNACKEEYEPAE